MNNLTRVVSPWGADQLRRHAQRPNADYTFCYTALSLVLLALSIDRYDWWFAPSGRNHSANVPNILFRNVLITLFKKHQHRQAIVSMTHFLETRGLFSVGLVYFFLDCAFEITSMIE